MRFRRRVAAVHAMPWRSDLISSGRGSHPTAHREVARRVDAGIPSERQVDAGDAGPAPHDIDVVVIGEPEVDAVYEACTRVEAAVHRPVTPTISSPEEFAAPSSFLDDVRSGPAVAVIGELPWD